MARVSALSIPEPHFADPEPVASALETAAVLISRGDQDEALRWLQRAEQSARENGMTVRAADLSRAAANFVDCFSVAPVSRRIPVALPEPEPPPAPRDAARITIPDAPMSRQPAELSTAECPEQTSNRQAVRVAVHVTAAGRYVVEPIAHDRAAPPGTREALLVFVEPGTHLQAP